MEDFGFKTKNTYYFKNTLKTETIEFPPNSKLTCEFHYDNTDTDDELIARVRQHLKARYNDDGTITLNPIESGNEFYTNLLTLSKGIYRYMTHVVHE